MRFRKVSALLMCILVLEPAWSADFWLKKPYTSWSEQECKDLLMKSPWSLTYTDTSIYEPATNMGSGNTTLTPGQQRGSLEPQTGEREVFLYFQFTLMRAKPIWMARGQMMLLKAPEAKSQVEQMLNQPVGKEIVVQISYSSQPPGVSQIHDIQNFFRRASLADFQGMTALASSDNKTVPISAYVQPTERNPFPLLVFPRFDQSGQPYFTGKEKSITLRCECKIPLASKEIAEPFRMTVKMEPKKMIFDNEFCM